MTARYPWLDKSFVISNLLSLFFGLLSTYLFYASLQYKEITHLFSKQPSKILDRTIATSKFTVLDNNGSQIEENIYLMNVSVWNSGNQPIEPSDVRQPLRVIVFPATQILDISIVSSVRPDVGSYRVEEVDTSSNPTQWERYRAYIEDNPMRMGFSDLSEVGRYMKIIELRWDHLDPGFGAKVQVTFTGQRDYDKYFNAHLDGYIIGVNRFQSADLPIAQRFSLSDAPYIKSFSGPVIFVIVVFLLPAALLNLVDIFSRNFRFRRHLLIGSIVFIPLWVWSLLYYLFSRYSPPQGLGV